MINYKIYVFLISATLIVSRGDSNEGNDYSKCPKRRN